MVAKKKTATRKKEKKSSFNVKYTKLSKTLKLVGLGENSETYSISGINSEAKQYLKNARLFSGSAV